MGDVTVPQAEAISLKTSLTQLGIWLNQNKQKNVPNITMAGSPVAAKAGIMDLVFAFATQYALAVVGVAEAPVKELQVSFSSIFNGIKNFISDKIDFIKDLIVAGNPAETSAAVQVKATPPYYDISPGADYDTIVLTYPAIATSAEPLKQAMLNVQAYATEMYTASGLEKIYNTIQIPFNAADKILVKNGIEGFGEVVSLKNTVSFLANKVAVADLQTKYETYVGIASNPLSGLPSVTAALADVNTSMGQVQTLIDADQLEQRKAESKNVLVQEMGMVHDMLERFETDKAAALADDDTDTYNDIVAFEKVYRDTIDPTLLPLLDQIILVNKQLGDALTADATTTITVDQGTSTAPNNNRQPLGTIT